MKSTNPFWIWFAACLVLAVVGLFFGEGLIAGLTLGVPLVLVSLWAMRHFEHAVEMDLASIFLVAVVLRWVAAAAIHIGVYPKLPWVFSPDESGYDITSHYIAEELHGRVPVLDTGYLIGRSGAVWVGVACHYVFGYSPLAPKLVNGVVGGWNAVITALVAVRFTSPKVARRAGWLSALLPSLALWASLYTKDNFTLLGTEISILAFLHLRERFRLEMLALYVGGLAFVASNRAYEVAFLALGTGAGYAFTTMRHLFRKLVVFALLMGVLVVVVQQSGALEIGADNDQSTLQRINLLRGSYSDAGSAIEVASSVDTSTPLGMAAWLPIGFFYFFFAPVPFTGRSLISSAATPEMLIWYSMVPSLLRGLRDIVRTRLRLAAPALLYVLAAAGGWAAVVTNVGSLFRYRGQVAFVLLILIAYDQVRRREAAAAAAPSVRFASPPPRDRVSA